MKLRGKSCMLCDRETLLKLNGRFFKVVMRQSSWYRSECLEVYNKTDRE